MKTMDLILAIVCILTVAFTVTMIVLFWTHYAIPDTLVTCFFGCVGGECGIMGWIKTSKERNRTRAWQLEDEKRMEEKESGQNP